MIGIWKGTNQRMAAALSKRTISPTGSGTSPYKSLCTRYGACTWRTGWGLRWHKNLNEVNMCSASTHFTVQQPTEKICSDFIISDGESWVECAVLLNRSWTHKPTQGNHWSPGATLLSFVSQIAWLSTLITVTQRRKTWYPDEHPVTSWHWPS